MSGCYDMDGRPIDARLNGRLLASDERVTGPPVGDALVRTAF